MQAKRGWINRAWRGFWRGLAVRALKYSGIPLRDPALVALLGGHEASSGVAVDEVSAMNYSAVWQAVRIISEPLASLPVYAYRSDDSGSQTRLYNDPRRVLLSVQPNPEMGSMVMRETMQAHALTWGNGYGWIERDPSGMARAIWPMLPSQIYPTRDEQGAPVYQFVARNDGEKDEQYAASDVLHVPGLSFDGRRGYPVIQMARESIGLGLATERYGAGFFGRGATPGGVLEHPGELSEQAKQNLRRDWEEMHRGPYNAHRIAVLEEGMKFTPAALPQKDAQFLETRQFQITEIARWFNVPPHMLRDLSQATFSNIEHQGIEFLVYTLRPWLTRWEQEYERKLFSVEERVAGMGVAHDVTSLVMTDITSRYGAYNVGRNGGWLTLNDILRREHMPLIKEPWGDEHIAPSTMVALGSESWRKPVAAPVDPQRMITILTAISAQPASVPLDAAKAMLRAAMPEATENLLCRLIDYLKTNRWVASEGGIR